MTVKQFTPTTFFGDVWWQLVKVRNSAGTLIGDDMGAGYTRLPNIVTIDVTNIVGNQWYFFPKISNRSSVQCEVRINDGLIGSFSGVYTTPNSEIGFGYYRLYYNSNVSLYCADGRGVSWWGIRPGQVGGSPLSDIIKKESGIMDVAINN